MDKSVNTTRLRLHDRDIGLAFLLQPNLLQSDDFGSDVRKLGITMINESFSNDMTNNQIWRSKQQFCRVMYTKETLCTHIIDIIDII